MEFIKFQGKREYSKLFKATKEIDKDFNSASPPSVFIGSHLTQKILNVGILSPPERLEQAWLYDAPKHWYNHNYNIDEIASLRASLINSRFKANILDVRKENKFLEIAKEIIMTLKPVDIEVNLEKKPQQNKTLDKIAFPSGPIAKLRNIKITSNTKINQRLDKVYSDNDLKATEAINYLYKHNFDEHTLSKLLSLGIFGLKKNRRLVPTRWSIVASMDTISKHLLNDIKDFNSVDDYRLYTGNYFGNYYFIMFFPDIWSYELIEMYLPSSVWNFSGKIEVATDYESYRGRKDYAKNTVGGYYQSKFKILEHLKKIRRQASCLVIRFETPEYTKPLGVWVVGVAAENALENNYLQFNSLEEMLNYTKNKIINRFRVDISKFLQNSILLKNLKTQTKLFS